MLTVLWIVLDQVFLPLVLHYLHCHHAMPALVPAPFVLFAFRCCMSSLDLRSRYDFHSSSEFFFISFMILSLRLVSS